MHILLIEPVIPNGAECVPRIADAGHEVTLVVQDFELQKQGQCQRFLERAGRILEVPNLGHGEDIYSRLSNKWGDREPDAIICHYDGYLEDAVTLAHILNIPSEDIETAKLISHKSSIRQHLAASDIHAFAWNIVTSVEELIEGSNYLGFPVIAKPLTVDFHPHVTVVKDKIELMQLWDSLEAGKYHVILLAKENNNIYLCASGPSLSAEVLVQQGKVIILGYSEYISSKERDDNLTIRHFIRVEDMGQEVSIYITKIIHCLGVKNSPLRIDFILSSHGPLFVDIHCHLADYSLTRQLSLILDRSLVNDQLALASGNTLSPIVEAKCEVIYIPLEIRYSGLVISIDDINYLPPQVVEYQRFASKGDRINGATNNPYVIGYLLISAENKKKCESYGRDAADIILNSFNISRVLPKWYEFKDGLEYALDIDFKNKKNHVLLLDRKGPDGWTLANGEPVLPEESYHLSVFSTSPELGSSGVSPDLSINLNIFDLNILKNSIRSLHKNLPIDRISSCSELVLPVAAELRVEFGASGNTPEFVNRFIDKAVMKRLAQINGIACADGCVVNTIHDIEYLMQHHSVVVVKPRSRTGSQGVSILKTAAEIDEWVSNEYIPGVFLAEGYIEGEMCHIDALVYDNEIIWDMSVYSRDTLAYTRCQPISSISPEDLNLRSQAYELLERIIEGWSVESAILHAEAFITAKGLIFCEVAARPGGAGIGDAFMATQGINLHHAQLLLDCGEDPRLHRVDPIADYSSWTIHYTDQSGILSYFDDSEVSDHIYKKKLLAEPGHKLPISTFSGTGISLHVFISNHQYQIEHLAKCAETKIRYDILPCKV